MKIKPFLAIIPLFWLGGTTGNDRPAIDAKLLTGNIALTLKHGVWKVANEKPVFQNITIDLTCDRGVCQPEAWAYAPKFNKDVDHRGTVKVTGLDSSWRLEVRMKVRSHPWSEEVREAVYNIDLVPHDGELLGSYSGDLGGRELQNKVTGTLSPLWPLPVNDHEPVKPLEHPRLIFRRSRLAELREKARTPIGKEILRQLDESLKQKIYYGGIVPNGGYHATGYCLQAILENNPEKAEKAGQIVDIAIKTKGDRVLEQAPIVAGVALAYDLCYEYWREARKITVTHWLYNQGRYLLKGGSPREGWNSTAWSNWNARARGAAGLAALAILYEPLNLKEDPLYSPEDQVMIAQRQMGRYLGSTFGDGGFGTEGDHYSTEPLIISVFPLLQAYRNVLGRDLYTGSNAEKIIPNYLTRVVPREGLLKIPAYGRHNRYMGISLFTMALGLIPDNLVGAVKWTIGGRERELFDLYYPQIVPYILAGYRPDVKPVNPIDTLGRVLIDNQKGFYVFRDRWRDKDDFIASIYLKQQPLGASWSFPDVGSIRIWGLGGNWANFNESEGKWNQENIAILPNSSPWGSAKPVYFKDYGQGSGSLTLRTDYTMAKGVKPAAGAALIRSFAVDYSGRSSAPGLFILRDKFIGNLDYPQFRGRTWVMNTAGKVALENNGFIISNNDGATMRGTFIYPEKTSLSLEKTPNGTRILATGGEEFLVIMTVRKGNAPKVVRSDNGIKIGNREITIDGDNIVFNGE